jgi:hypothetical protein
LSTIRHQDSISTLKAKNPPLGFEEICIDIYSHEQIGNNSTMNVSTYLGVLCCNGNCQFWELVVWDYSPNQLVNQFIWYHGATSFSDTTSFQVFMIFYYHVQNLLNCQSKQHFLSGYCV